MGDFHEHVVFGFLVAAVVSYALQDLVDLTAMEVTASAVMVVVGAILPDIDHKHAYVHRAAQSFASIGAGILVIIYAPLPIYVGCAAAALVFLLVYTGFSRITLTHRGFTHSLSFLVLLSVTAMVSSSHLMASLVPGIALGIGISSHLLLDQHVSLA